ncbi:MAG: hypothetical protein ACRDTQ_02785 [Micromonosporaceae bacterium]
MSTYQEAASKLQAAAESLGQGAGHAMSGGADLDSIAGRLASVGHNSGAQEATAVKSEVESYANQLQALVSQGNELASRIAALGNG